MGLVDRINAEVRTIGGVPWQPWLNPYWRFNIGGPVHPSQQVQGVDQVLGLSAVYACVRIISDMIASLPINVYRNNGDGTSVRLNGSQLLDSPSVTGTVYDWIFQGTSSALLHGNSIGYITTRTGVTGPNGLGYPQTVEWMPYDRIHIQDDEQQPWNPLRAKFFFDGYELDRSEIIHMRAFTIPGRTAGISPMRAFATLIGQGLQALNYSHDWFHNGGFPPGTFQNTAEEVDKQQATEIRQRLTDTLRMHQPLVYGRDWEYKAISIPPKEAAFVEAMQLNATQVAAIYGLPPERVGGRRGDSLTYSTEQQEVLAIITDTLRPWLVRWEQLLRQLLPTTQYVKFDVDELLKTDLKTRYEIFAQQMETGLRTIDELRNLDDLPPLPNGKGQLAMPLGGLERMLATTRAIPKPYIDDLILEQEVAAETLLKLAAEGQVAPPQPGKAPVNSNAEQYLGRLITLQRAAPIPARPEPAADDTSSGGEGTSPFGPHHQRATHADRQRASDWIKNAHVLGALKQDEHDQRQHAAKNAAMKGALADLIKDLPSEKELHGQLQKLADAPPNKRRADQPPQPMFGPQAMALLRELQQRWDGSPADVVASMNGKAH